VELASARDCWVRDIEMINPDSGVLLNYQVASCPCSGSLPRRLLLAPASWGLALHVWKARQAARPAAAEGQPRTQRRVFGEVADQGATQPGTRSTRMVTSIGVCCLPAGVLRNDHRHQDLVHQDAGQQQEEPFRRARQHRRPLGPRLL
jgi:hypothetical protein